MTSFESARTCTTLGENCCAACKPAISALYSATLFVVVPMRSLTAARRVGGVVDGSTTTAPIADGPGLPREPPSAKTITDVGHGTRMAPQLSQCEIVPSGDFLIARDLGGRDGQVTALARGADQPRGTGATVVGAHAFVVGEQRGVELGRDRVPCGTLDRGLGRDLLLRRCEHARARRPSRPATRRDGRRARRGSASIGSRCSMSSSSVVSSVSLRRSIWSMSACIDWSSFGELISPEYIFLSTAFAFSRSDFASSSSFCSSRASSSRCAVSSLISASSAATVASARASASRSGSVWCRWRRRSSAPSCSCSERSARRPASVLIARASPRGHASRRLRGRRWRGGGGGSVVAGGGVVTTGGTVTGGRTWVEGVGGGTSVVVTGGACRSAAVLVDERRRPRRTPVPRAGARRRGGRRAPGS